jgi:DNA-binding transcriptional LysR family regulator
MDLSELEVLISLAQEGSFSRAAESLHRSQPAVSQAIRRLEDEVQAQLMDRTSRKVVLTAAGTTLLGYAKRMIQLREDAKRALEELRSFKRGVLRLAANESVCSYVLPALLKAFRQRLPAVKIEVLQCPSNGISTLLEEQDVDFGFLSFTPVQHDLISRLLFRDELALVVFPGHPLAKSKSVILQQLGSEKFVAHMAETPSRKRLMDLFAREGVPLGIIMELSSLETIKDFVKAGEASPSCRACASPGSWPRANCARRRCGAWPSAGTSGWSTPGPAPTPPPPWPSLGCWSATSPPRSRPRLDAADRISHTLPLRGPMTFSFAYTYAYRFFSGGGLVRVGALN